MKKHKILSLAVAAALFIAPTFAHALTILDQTVASTTDQTSSSQIFGAGVSPLIGQGSWTDPVHDTIYNAISGNGFVTLTEGQNIDVEANGVQCAFRITGESRGNFTGQTLGVNGCQGGVKVMPGAEGNAAQLNANVGTIVNASPTFHVEKAAIFSGGVQGTGGNVDKQLIFWCKGMLNYGTVSNICLQAGFGEPPTGNWFIHDTTGYQSLLSAPLNINASNFSLASDGSQSFFKVSGTTPTSTTAIIKGIDFPITAAPSAAAQLFGMNLNLLDGGYNSSGTTAGLNFANSAKGTGNNYFTGSGNFGIWGITNANSPTADNGGGWFNARNGLRNIAMTTRAIVATPTGGLNIGSANFAVNSNGNAVAVYAGLNSSIPTISDTAALIADNGSVNAPIFLARKNGVTKVSIDANGNLCLGTDCMSEDQLHDILGLIGSLNNIGRDIGKVLIGLGAFGVIAAAYVYNNRQSKTLKSPVVKNA